MRLIDADTLKEHKYHSNEDGTPVEFSAWKQGWNDAIDAITNYALTVDAVEVVRCKDCKHRDPEDHKCDCGALERGGCVFPVGDDYFCFYGERREDETN